MRRAKRSERGHAYLILLVLAVMTTMLGMTMIVNSTAGITSEARRDAEDRARLNAESGLTMADFALKREMPVLLKRVAVAANAEEGFAGPNMLSGIEFAPVDYHFEIPGEGNTAEDAADVRVEVTLPGPATTTNFSGVGAGPELGAVETYCFVANLRSTGRSKGGAAIVADRVSHVYVTLVLGEIEAGTLAGLGTGNVIEIGAGASPLLDPRVPESSWELVPSAMAANTSIQVGSVTVRDIGLWTITPGGAATGSWTGGPVEVVPDERRMAGLPGGDTFYYFYVRGLPDGSVAVPPQPGDTPGAVSYVLATDGWRFTPNYRAADDTVPIRMPGGAIVRKMGTPNYGVIAVRAPIGVDAARAASPPVPLRFRIYIPGLGSQQYEVADRQWAPETVEANGSYTLLGWPNPSEIGSPSGYVGAVNAGGAAAINLRHDANVTVGTFVGGIGVPGDVPAGGQMVGTGGSGGTTPGTIPLMTILGRRARVTMSYDGSGGRATAETTNSGHTAAPAEGIGIGGGGGGGGVIIVDPPPPGTEPKVRIIAVMYVPLWTSYVPDTGGRLPIR